MLMLTKNTLNIGLEKPLKILHITDSHIPFCCDEDPEGMHRQRAERDEEGSVRSLQEQIAYGEENCDLILHTGDLIDFISKPCLAFARDFFPKHPKVHFIAGNHEYSKYDYAVEDMDYRIRSLMDMGGGLGVDMFFSSRVVGGVNFVGIDDGYHQVEDGQLIRLKKEVAKGLPIILFLHAPLYEEALYRASCEFWNGEIAVVASDSARHPEVIGDMAEPYPSTKAFYDYVCGEPMIKAVLAGHVHFPFESTLPGGTPQFVTGLGSEGHAREITIF